MERVGARKPWVAGLLSVLLPGLGHLYNGFPGQAASALGVMALISASGPAVTWGTYPGMVATYLAQAAWLVVVATHAAVQARRTGEVALGWYQRWPAYLLIPAAVYLGMRPAFNRVLLPHCRFRAYSTPTTSMADTVRLGDLVVADTHWYRSRTPARGDLVVFRYPVEPSKEFLKRCIAVAGDTVSIEDKRVTLNGRTLAEPYVIHTDPDVLPSFLGPGFDFAKRDNMAAYRVPDHAFFAMGDNRDASYDSRFWGSVDLSAVRGKALYLCWSNDHKRIGTRVR